MKYLFLLILLSGCTTYKSHIVHSESFTPEVYKIPSMERCIPSGFVVNDKLYNVYYENCDIYLKRHLMKKERKLWP